MKKRRKKRKRKKRKEKETVSMAGGKVNVWPTSRVGLDLSIFIKNKLRARREYPEGEERVS